MTARYNGWTNYETWCVNLWLTNDPITESYLMDVVDNYNTYEAEDLLRDTVEEWCNEFTSASMFNDLLGHALQAVNWIEIIESHKED